MWRSPGDRASTSDDKASRDALPFSSMSIIWKQLGTIPSRQWRCAYCDREVASDKGWIGETYEQLGSVGHPEFVYVAVCPRCELPTILSSTDSQVPGVRYGERVLHLPDDVAGLYDEARYCMSVNAHTAAVLLGRKLLMHVAVAQGADENQTFGYYVGYLQEHGSITVSMAPWVDQIRTLGNEAAHELRVMTTEQAQELLTFVGMLLKVIYEYPEKARLSARDNT